jgi:ATP-dependent Clp protease protease subunit
MRKFIEIGAWLVLVFALVLLVSPILVSDDNGSVNIQQETVAKYTIDPINKNISYSVLRQKVNKDRTIFIQGTISNQTLKVVEKIKELDKSSNKPIYLVMTSPGGSVVAGAQIITAIQTSKAPIYTVAYSWCASMCAAILEYGEKRYATPRTVIMFHEATAGTNGDVERMYSLSKFLKSYVNKIEVHIASRMGVTFDKYKKTIAYDLRLDAEDALKLNLIDRLVVLSEDVNGLDFIFSNEQEDEKFLEVLKW